jgi:AcrR family transcriptional regulator
MTARQTSTTTTKRRAGAVRGQLDRDRIVGVAAEMVEREGIDAFTMRALAARLGVGTMTVYGHFRDKDALLDAVIDMRIGEVAIPAREGEWRERLTALLRELRALLLRHPFGVRVRMSRPIASPGAMRVAASGLSALGDAGLDSHAALYAWRALFNYTFASVAFETGAVSDAERQAMQAVAHVPADASEHELVEAVGASQFEFGLELMLDGIDARVRP